MFMTPSLKISSVNDGQSRTAPSSTVTTFLLIIRVRKEHPLKAFCPMTVTGFPRYESGTATVSAAP